MRLTSIAVVLAGCFVSVSAAEPDAAAFEKAIDRGLYREADTIARERLAGVSRSPDFRSADVRTRYLDAIKSADLWARWKEGERLLQELLKGMHQERPADRR